MDFFTAKACVLTSYDGVDLFYRKCHMANAMLAGLTGNRVVYGLAKSHETGVLNPHVWTETSEGIIQDVLEDYYYEHTHVASLIKGDAFGNGAHQFLIANFYGQGHPIRADLTQAMIDCTRAGGNPVLIWRTSRGV